MDPSRMPAGTGEWGEWLPPPETVKGGRMICGAFHRPNALGKVWLAVARGAPAVAVDGVALTIASRLKLYFRCKSYAISITGTSFKCFAP